MLFRSTVSELAAAGMPSVLVPFPHAVDDHQTANARFLADRGAAVLLPETDLARLETEVTRLLDDTAARDRMAAAMRDLARPEAAERLADLMQEIAA